MKIWNGGAGHAPHPPPRPIRVFAVRTLRKKIGGTKRGEDRILGAKESILCAFLRLHVVTQVATSPAGRESSVLQPVCFCG